MCQGGIVFDTEEAVKIIRVSKLAKKQRNGFPLEFILESFYRGRE
jgi:hypothetical protein